MPREDRTGPRGEGPLTGRGYGPCGDESRTCGDGGASGRTRDIDPGYQKDNRGQPGFGAGSGQRLGLGRGLGFGRGQGRGRRNYS